MTKKQKTEVVRYSGFGLAGLAVGAFLAPTIEKMTRPAGYGNEAFGQMSYQQETKRIDLAKLLPLGLGVIAGVVVAGTTKLLK